MDDRNFYDVVVVGGGPAGLTAGLYLARACYRVLVVEKETFGGQITITSEVVNYPGAGRTDGRALTDTMRAQAESFGAEFLMADVTNLELDGDVKKVHTDRGVFSCFGVLIATGAHPRVLGFPGETEFRGRGVAYCATCDGEFFTGKEVFVIGGGFAAAEESVFLTRYARHVTVLVREDAFTCAEATARGALEHPKVTVLTNTQVVEVSGDTALRRIRYKNSKTGTETVFSAEDGDTFGVFVFAGYVPATDLVKGKVELNPQGYVVTDRSQKTSLDGVYAAGDVCVKNLRQVVTAVGDGATAATELERYAAAMQAKTGIHPKKPVRTAAAPTREAKREAPAEGGLFSEDMRQQMEAVFARMEQNLILELFLDDRPVSRELQGYMTELAGMTDKLTVRTGTGLPEAELPCVRVLKADGTDTGLAFHGVPGGHEFTSFMLGLYNAAGPGQSLDDTTRARIRAIDRKVGMKVLVSLSCTMCPELVAAAQQIAALNPSVTADVYDINHFGALKERYNVMSVPCLVIDDDRVTFGKKGVQQLLDEIG
ncbi:FAD-dependent oxidoreductase [Fretibacterium fastidiosum]|uniref:Alkyl hydroperoxide reductase F subunit n=1 Tax=Fretibacterium fastidiosum TaxID=651822 RepID=A0AB94IWL7_9BACT|nr:FAD-dependent oxidoreductase [Fretibacterium fastidiosum]CBL28176.1 putative alkyl hydroperoxide reductase F subunit [Fretibacterium fastidiosum]